MTVREEWQMPKNWSYGSGLLARCPSQSYYPFRVLIYLMWSTYD